MPRRVLGGIACVALVLFVGAFGYDVVEAHAGLRLSDPLEGATLGDSPGSVRLYFTEAPEPSLSDIRVLDLQGVAYRTGPLGHVGADPLSLTVAVRPLTRGIYIVNWRAVSAIDGHATTGSYAFGVRAVPDGMPIAAPSAGTEWIEIAARTVLLTGLVLLLGAAAAGAAEFGGAADIQLAAVAWPLSVVGLVCLAVAQQRHAAVPLSTLLTTVIGRALLWRAVAIAAAGMGLAVAWRERHRRRLVHVTAMSVMAVAVLAAMAVHVAAGHAAAGVWLPPAVTVIVQWTHFATAGLWLGGLAALLLGLRGAPSAAKTAAIHRFSSLALVSLACIIVTGVVRTMGGLSEWRDLVRTPYGAAVSAKIVFSCAILVLGAVNRWRSVPAAASTLAPLRRVGVAEIVCGFVALAAAAVLGSFAPPGDLETPLGLSASGSDFGTTVRVALTAASDQPGPNRFVVHVRDYDSMRPIAVDRVSLRFSPLDDPDIPPTMLVLARGGDGEYVGSGANLAFEGRWRVGVLVERGAGSTDVPLEVETRGRAQFVSVLREPGKPAEYTVEVRAAGHVRISPDPERPGRSQLSITCTSTINEDLAIDVIVVTAAAGEGPARQLAVRRTGPNTFVSDVDLHAGRNRIAVVARTREGSRLRAVMDLHIPRQ